MSFPRMQFEYLSIRLRKPPSAYSVPGSLPLSDIVNITQGLGLIASIEKDDWEAILTVRNIVVHNNGISDIDANYQVGPVRVELKKNQMTRGRMDFFPELTRQAMLRYNSWVRALAGLS